MDAIRGHWQQEAQFQEQPTALSERQDPVDGLWFHREQGPLRPLRAPPPSPAMRCLACWGIWGMAEADGASAGRSLTTGSPSTTSTRTRGSSRSTGSQTTTRDPGRLVDSRNGSSSRQYGRRAIDVPSTIIIDDGICAAVEDGRWRRELRRDGESGRRKKKRRDRDGSESRQLTPSRFLLPGRAPAALCAMCDLQLPLKSPHHCGLSCTWQAPPTILEPINGSDRRQAASQVRQENLLSVSCSPSLSHLSIVPFHQFIPCRVSSASIPALANNPPRLQQFFSSLPCPADIKITTARRGEIDLFQDLNPS